MLVIEGFGTVDFERLEVLVVRNLVEVASAVVVRGRCSGPAYQQEALDVRSRGALWSDLGSEGIENVQSGSWFVAAILWAISLNWDWHFEEFDFAQAAVLLLLVASHA